MQPFFREVCEKVAEKRKMCESFIRKLAFRTEVGYNLF